MTLYRRTKIPAIQHLDLAGIFFDSVSQFLIHLRNVLGVPADSCRIQM